MTYLNNKIVDTRRLASKGRFGDNKIAMIGGQPSHVNSEELNLLNAWEMDGNRRMAEEEIQSEGKTVNPGTGLDEYFSYSLANTYMPKPPSIGPAVASSVAGGGGILAGLSKAAGPIGMGIQAVSMLVGAGKKQKAALDQKAALERGIEGIDAERQELGERATEDIDKLWGNVGEKLSDIRYGIGESYEGVSDTVGKVLKQGKGLKTGTPEQIVSTATDKASEKLSMVTEDLERETADKVDLYGRKMEDETTSMTRKIKDMKSQIGSLDTSFMGNIFG